MARRLVDLSVALQAGIASDPPGHLPEIDYYDHRQTAAEVVSFFPGATVADLPDGEGWAIERVRVTTHNGMQHLPPQGLHEQHLSTHGWQMPP